MIGPNEFALLKPEAILINGARGPIVQETALLDALDQGRLRAAGLDVFAGEPLPKDSPLRDTPKVLRSEARRVGKTGGSTGRSGGSAYMEKKKDQKAGSKEN